MEQILKNGDIIELEDKEFYYVVARVAYKGEEYADVIKYPENPKDLFNEDKYERITIKVEKKGDEAFVCVVKDEEIQAKVRKAGESKTKLVKRVKKA